ncbi:MAG: hypothetical protein CMF12_12270 [Idiomarina sp.]|uniref:hypothetical protein n=1 Tax=Idiomarina sp. TaxID=1874361 RepID=UPI000C67272A|nr:hypothetical protein [Idiomarina sp.]MBT43290.1 hypothetical protein [Idiomarina sp.]
MKAANVHYVYSDDEARKGKLRLRFIQAAIVVSVVFMLFFAFYLAHFDSTHKLIGMAALIGAFVSMVLFRYNLPSASFYDVLPGAESKELAEMLSFLPSQRRLFQQALSDGKKLRWRDYYHVYSAYHPIKDQQDSEAASAAITDS